MTASRIPRVERRETRGTQDIEKAMEREEGEGSGINSFS
jgi:hypothetical protein